MKGYVIVVVPPCCRDCDLYHCDTYDDVEYCQVTGDSVEDPDTRPKDCPIIPIPE